MENPSQELVVIFDCNPLAWGQVQATQKDVHGTVLCDVVDQVCAFLNAFFLLSRRNSAHILVTHPDFTETVFPRVDDSSSDAKRDASMTQDQSNGTDASMESRKRVRLDEQLSVTRPNISPSSSQNHATPASSAAAVATIKQGLLAACLKPTYGLTERISRDAMTTPGSVEDTKSSKDTTSSNSCLFAAALARAMCILNKRRLQNPNLLGRILIFQLSADNILENLQMMNSILLAQRYKILVDTCSFANEPSLVLQNAAYLTGGYLTHLPVARFTPVPTDLLPGSSPTAAGTASTEVLRPLSELPLLQHLLMVHLPDPVTRASLAMPSLTSVNLKATCFCHGQVVDTAFVCPSCLGVYCKREIRCTTCGSRFLLRPQRPAGPPLPGPGPQGQLAPTPAPSRPSISPAPGHSPLPEGAARLSPSPSSAMLMPSDR